MDINDEIDFEDYLGATLPFERTNPHNEELYVADYDEDDEVNILELDNEGNVIDIISAPPYVLQDITKEFDLLECGIECGPEELGLLKLSGSLSGKTGGVLSTSGSGVLGVPKTSTSFFGQFVKPVTSFSTAAKLAAKRAASKTSTKVSKPFFMPGKLSALRGLTPKQIAEIKAKSAMMARAKAEAARPILTDTPRPTIIAAPKPQPMPDAAAFCGCARIKRIESMLKKAEVQRIATQEHRKIMRNNKFRKTVLNKLNRIASELPYGPARTRIESKIKAACGMG